MPELSVGGVLITLDLSMTIIILCSPVSCSDKQRNGRSMNMHRSNKYLGMTAKRFHTLNPRHHECWSTNRDTHLEVQRWEEWAQAVPNPGIWIRTGVKNPERCKHIMSMHTVLLRAENPWHNLYTALAQVQYYTEYYLRKHWFPRLEIEILIDVRNYGFVDHHVELILLDIDIPEEKTSTETSNDEGDFITVTGTKRARRESRKAQRPLVSWRPTIQSDIN